MTTSTTDKAKKNAGAQRAELHRRIWTIADDVRGAVDGWDFKQYILGILFYRFISENMADHFNRDEWEAGFPDFDYAAISDEEADEQFRPGTVQSKGFFILPSQLFVNVARKAPHNENLNTELAEIFRAIESSALGYASEDDIKGLFEDVDMTSNRLGSTVADKTNASPPSCKASRKSTSAHFRRTRSTPSATRMNISSPTMRVTQANPAANFSPRRPCPNCSHGSSSTAKSISIKSTTRRAAADRYCFR